MRIRSIKPEFWRSDDIDALDWHDRLLFIGLWSYVDDNGVGRDKVANVAADIFAGDLSVDPTETLRRVSLGLNTLHEAGLIARYKVGGKGYLHITAWERHQLVKNPNKARYPLPTCEDSVPTETLRTSSVDPTETLPTGAGEQRSRGTEEQGIPPTADAAPPPSRALAVVDTEPTAQTLVAEWIDHCPQRPAGSVIGQVAKHLKSMLDEDIHPDRLRRALAEWNRKGLHPSTLPSVLHEVENRRPANRSQQATDDLFDAAMARAVERDRNAS